jgi:hypothetical protein
VRRVTLRPVSRSMRRAMISASKMPSVSAFEPMRIVCDWLAARRS